MDITLKVTPFSPKPGEEYDAARYPGLGMYHDQVSGDWYLVYQPKGCTINCVANVGNGTRCPLPAIDQGVTIEALSIGNPGIQASDILKAIAISQNPALARELLK